MQKVTAWGALESPDGEYWWDGRSWRPMYTPDRLHAWDGSGWQPNPAAQPLVISGPPPPPVAGGSSSLPSWLPPGATLRGAGAAAAARPAPAPAEPPVRSRPRLIRGRGLLAALATVLVLVAGLAVAGTGYVYYQRVTAMHAASAGPVGLAAIALQGRELPAGLSRCEGVYFNQQGYLRYMQRKHPEQYQTAVNDWSRSQQEGALDAWYSGYADDPSRCDKLAAGGDIGAGAKGAMNVVFQTRDVASATRAVKDSFNSVPAFVSPQRGAATGLGENSLVAYTEAGSFRSYLAIWQAGRYASLLSLNGVSLDDSQRAARAINLRMGA